MGAVKFYRGSFEAYSEGLAEGKYNDGLFFDENTHTIYLNGQEYGASTNVDNIATKEWVIENYGDAFHDVLQEITETGGFTASFFSAYDDSATGSISIPIASATSAGLLSSEDKSKINSFDSDNFVQKEEGKGLSTNDYTTDEKNKLSNIENNAQVNKIEIIKIDGVQQDIVDKVVDLDIKSIVEDTINTTVTSVYRYRDSVATAEDLPTIDLNNGDVYNIEAASEYGAAGVNVAWNGNTNKWDSLGGIFSTADLEHDIEVIQSDITALTGRVDILESHNLNSRLDTVETAIDTFNGAETTSGSIKYISKQMAETVINNTLAWETI